MNRNIVPIIAMSVASLLLAGTAPAQNGAREESSSSSSASAATQSQSAATQNQAAAQTQQGPAQISGSSATSASGSSAASANGAVRNHNESASLANGTAINAKLMNPLDARKSQPGEMVTAQVTAPVQENGKVVLPKGTKLIGHVTQAEERTKSQTESTLGVVFDKAALRNGQTMPVQLGFQALAAPQASLRASGADSGFAAGAGGSAVATSHAAAGANGLVGGTTQLASATVNDAAGTAAGATNAVAATTGSAARSAGRTAGAVGGSVGGVNASGSLAANSRGVFGLQGLALRGSASGTASGTAVVSATRNVHLDSGTQMVLAASGQVN